MGLTDFGKLSIDGTKVRANASKRKAMSYDRMKREEARLRAEIQALLARAGEVDAEEDARLGEAVRGWRRSRRRRHDWKRSNGTGSGAGSRDRIAIPGGPSVLARFRGAGSESGEQLHGPREAAS